MYFLVVRQKFTANVVVGLLGNESSDSNRFTLVTPKPENGVRLQATLGNQNPTGLPVRAVRRSVLFGDSQWVTDTQKLHTTETRMKCMLIFIKRLVIQKFKEKNLT